MFIVEWLKKLSIKCQRRKLMQDESGNIVSNVKQFDFDDLEKITFAGLFFVNTVNILNQFASVFISSQMQSLQKD